MNTAAVMVLLAAISTLWLAVLLGKGCERGNRRSSGVCPECYRPLAAENGGGK
jgi:hypothetical protein